MAPDWLGTVARSAGGRSGALLLSTPWADTPLGPPSTWPDGLRGAVRTCFAARFPMLVAWGPDLTVLYNDGYAQMLGTDLHPRAWAAPFRDVWADARADVGPLVDRVLGEGCASWVVDQPLVLDRSGFLEEIAFTSSYSPLHDDDGAVVGLLQLAYETTAQVVDRRRLEAVAALAAAVADPPREVAALADVVIEHLSRTPDVATAALHVHVDDELRLVGAMPEALPPAVGRLLVGTVARSGVTVEHGTCLVLPLPDPRADGPAGVLVLAGNPRHPWDEGQRGFLRLLASTVGTALRRTLEIGREIDALRTVSDALQAAMLPDAVDLPWLQTRYRPADDALAVGGDWYDVADLGDDVSGLLVGDCVGHGLGAAALMGQLRSAGRALLLQGNRPAEVVRTLDRFARRLPGAECTTVFCAVVDDRSGAMTYTAAGHPPPLVVGPTGSRFLQGGRSAPLAVTGRPRRDARTVLQPDETLLLYTDGLIERRDESLRVGLARLAAVGRDLLGGPLGTDVVDRLLVRMLPDGQADDVALLLYRRPDLPEAQE